MKIRFTVEILALIALVALFSALEVVRASLVKKFRSEEAVQKRLQNELESIRMERGLRLPTGDKETVFHDDRELDKLSDLDRSILTELSRWNSKVDLVRSELRSHPEKGIPEMGLLHEDDFFKMAKDRDVVGDPEELERVLAGLRSKAKVEVSPLIADALRQYVKTANGTMPATGLEILPYFIKDKSNMQAGQIAQDILARYSVIYNDNAGSAVAAGTPAKGILLEKEPADPHDQRLEIRPNGGVHIRMPPGGSR